MNRFTYISGFRKEPFVQLVNPGEVWIDKEGRSFKVAYVLPENDPNHEMAEVIFTEQGGDIFLHDMIVEGWKKV